MVRNANTTDSPAAPAPGRPADPLKIGIVASRDLAAILTPLMVEMVDEARVRAEAGGLGRYMAEPLAAVRRMVDQLRRYHGLPPLDADGVPATAANGQAPAESDRHGSEVPA
jgi:hypothetical protein